MAMPCVLRLQRCWRRGVSNYPYRPFAMPFLALGVVARTRYKSLGGQHLIFAANPGLSQERCYKNTRADFYLTWVPPASPLPSFSARMCLGKGRASHKAMTLVSICPSWTCYSPFRCRVLSWTTYFNVVNTPRVIMSVPRRRLLGYEPFTTRGPR